MVVTVLSVRTCASAPRHKEPAIVLAPHIASYNNLDNVSFEGDSINGKRPREVHSEFFAAAIERR